VTLRSRVFAITLAALAAALLAACVPMERPKLGPGPPTMKVSQIRSLGAAPVKGEDVRIAFITVTGIPAEMRFALEKSLKTYAATRQLNITIADDPTATYRIKGYLSAVGDRTSALLVYVWDVYDTNGTALHRISGQEVASGSEADPWVGVTTKNVDDSARETIDRLADWVKG